MPGAWHIYVTVSQAPPPPPTNVQVLPPTPPVGWGWGGQQFAFANLILDLCSPLPPLWVAGVVMGLFQPSLMAGQNHALRHVSPALHQNAGFACTAVLQTPTKLCQTSPQTGFALISLGNTRNLVAWPSPAWIDIALAGGGPESLVTGTYIDFFYVFAQTSSGRLSTDAYIQKHKHNVNG